MSRLRGRRELHAQEQPTVPGLQDHAGNASPHREPKPRATELKTHLFEKGTIAADEINVKLRCGQEVKSIALTTLTGGSGSYRASPMCDPYHHIVGSCPTVNSQP